MSTQYKQNFRSAWLKHDALKDWLEEVKENKISTARCKYCYKTLNTKLADLIKHATTQAHLKACGLEKSNKKIDSSTVVHHDHKLAKAEATYAMFIAAHCSILSADHLSEIVAKQHMSEFQCKRTKCTAIITDVLAPYFQTTLKQDIGSGFYSLLIDESTDISTEKYLGVAIIYFSVRHRKIIYTFLGLVNIANGEAATLCNALLHLLNEFGLEVEKIRGIGTDNANAMVGKTGGVYALMKAKNPNIVFVRCMNHSIELAVSHATEETFPRCLDYIIENTYSWFSKSSQRQLKYKELYQCIYDGKDPLKIPRKCDTRWMSVEPCVSRILEQWDVLKLHFATSRYDEKCYMAESLHEMYSDETNKAYFKFFQPLLVEINKINKTLQSNAENHIAVYESVLTLMHSWIYMIIPPSHQILKKDVFTTPISELKKILSPKPHLGYQFEKAIDDLIAKKKVSKEATNVIRKRCVDFILSLIEQFQKRLPDNVELLKQICNFQPKAALSQIKESISSLAEMFGYNELQITQLDKQWLDLHLVKWKNTNSTIELWNEVFFYEDIASNKRFEDLGRFVLSILILPHSNAEVERIFSQMNIIKSKCRNRLQRKSLTSIMHVRSGLKRESNCCSSYAEKIPEDVLNQVFSAKKYKPKEDVSESFNDEESDWFLNTDL